LAAVGMNQTSPDSGNGPIVILSYAYSGAQQVQDALAVGTGLACTSGTGIIPLCATAAESWRQVEGRDEPVMSRLAVSTTRALVAAQMTTILASLGQPRWCELSTAAPSAAEPLLQVFPQTAFVCVHRPCLDVIRAAVRANPWGLAGQGLTPYLLVHPGNSVAALAAHWAARTEELLAFEQAHPGHTRRVQYEEMIIEPSEALTALRAWLAIPHSRPSLPPEPPSSPPSDAPSTGTEVPVGLIPAPLRQRIGNLNAELGHADLW
jgi:hypothetical protein